MAFAGLLHAVQLTFGLGVLKCYSLLRRLSPAIRMRFLTRSLDRYGVDHFHCDLDVARLNQPSIATLPDEVHGQSPDAPGADGETDAAASSQSGRCVALGARYPHLSGNL